MIIGLQIEAHATHEAGGFVAFGGMDHQAGGFVEDQQTFVFMDNIEQRIRHARMVLPGDRRQYNCMRKKEEASKKATLLTTVEGMQIDYIEPSVVCAAQHALDVLDHEEGFVHAIESQGKTIWRMNPEKARESLAMLEKLGQGVCVR